MDRESPELRNVSKYDTFDQQALHNDEGDSMKDTDARMVTTSDLMSLIAEGNRLGLNRQLDADAVGKDADPRGVHVLGMLLPFHQAYNALPDHHRVLVYVKVKGSTEPSVAVMDITDEKWDRLTRAEDLQAASA